MSATTDILLDAFGRVREVVHEAVEGLDERQLTRRLDPEANSIAWLVWHLTRVQDDHIAAVAGRPQAWQDEGWSQRFGLPFEEGDIGYGHGTDDVAAVHASADLLTAYHEAVHRRTSQYLAGLSDDELPRIVDDSYDPPVTLAVRLVSVLCDDLQHAGQAAFVRGVVERTR